MKGYCKLKEDVGLMLHIYENNFLRSSYPPPVMHLKYAMYEVSIERLTVVKNYLKRDPKFGS